jgi:3-oxoadipate enol-lactonase/4-carboxymuconolactone decarboxylase
MPFTVNAGARLWWRADGLPEQPALLLLNAIGTTHALWDAVVPLLLPEFYIIRMDARGHGASDAPSADYTLGLLARDAEAVLDAAGVSSAAVAGISLGGMIAMRLALDAPRRVSRLLPICTSAALDPAMWVARLQAVQDGGMRAIVDAALGRFFRPALAARHKEAVASVRAAFLAQDPAGYCGCGAAIRDMALLHDLPLITAPTLVIAGRHDISTPFEAHGAKIAAAIPGAAARMVDTAHLAAIEDPAALAGAMIGFLQADDKTGPARAVLTKAGMARRREVLGDEWVDRSLRNATEFSAEYQEFITRIAWQEIWCRPGLDTRTRRLLVIAITASLARWEEFRLHVRAGLQQGGFTLTELREVLMQTAIYAGVPAANTAFAEAQTIATAISREQATNE